MTTEEATTEVFWAAVEALPKPERWVSLGCVAARSSSRLGRTSPSSHTLAETGAGRNCLSA